MRVVHILDHSVPLHSGYAFRTLSILKEQRALGWETFHLTGPKQGRTPANEEEVDGWHFYRTQPPGGILDGVPVVCHIELMGEIAHRLEEVVKRHRPHILHAHSPALNAIPALRVGRRLGIPVVYEVRAPWEDAAVDHGTAREGGLRYRLSRALETWALRRADGVTTICEGLRDEIAQRGVPLDRITIVPNAVDPTTFRSSGGPDAELRRRLGLGGSTVIGFVGSFYGYEGLDLLVEAICRLVPARPDLKLLLVGGGFQEGALNAQVLRSGLQGKVVFTGRVPHDEIQRYYDLIDLLAYPRKSIRLTELVTPLKPLEAMAQGRVLIASNVGGHRELIRDGETGFLFRPDDPQALTDAIDAALARRADWPKMRDAARSFVETERTWAASVGHYRALYERLCVPPRVALAG
jgi:PEP-CTERM/exosortase A-associated glycosyltransferase